MDTNAGDMEQRETGEQRTEDGARPLVTRLGRKRRGKEEGGRMERGDERADDEGEGGGRTGGDGGGDGGEPGKRENKCVH